MLIFSASNRVKCYIRVRPLNVNELEREDDTAVEVSEDRKEVGKDFCVGIDQIIVSRIMLVYYCKCCNLIGYSTRRYSSIDSE